MDGLALGDLSPGELVHLEAGPSGRGPCAWFRKVLLGLTARSPHQARLVVVVCTPIFPGTRYEDWELDDPAGLDLEGVRPIRDEVERRVRGLLRELGTPATGR